MKKERLIAFTDAVLAIIMTILVLELDRPASPTIQAFLALKQNYFAYFLSFFWLGSLWIALNGIWELVVRINNKVVWWNLTLLFLASFMPYATGLVSTYFMSRTVQAFYGLIVILTTLCNWMLHKVLDQPNADQPELLNETAAYRKLLLPDIAIKCVGLVLAILVYPPAMMIAVLLAAVVIISARIRMNS